MTCLSKLSAGDRIELSQMGLTGHGLSDQIWKNNTPLHRGTVLMINTQVLDRYRNYDALLYMDENMFGWALSSHTDSFRNQILGLIDPHWRHKIDIYTCRFYFAKRTAIRRLNFNSTIIKK